MRRLSWILTIPLTLILVVFAISNRQMTEVQLWPFGIELPVPLFALVLVCLLLGFLIGACVLWLSNGRHRRRMRDAHWRITDLERDLQDAKRREARAAKAVQPPAGGRLPSSELIRSPQRPAA